MDTDAAESSGAVSDCDDGHYCPNCDNSFPDRDMRQRAVSEWCAAAFGAGRASSIPQRAVRLLEEALEAYQSCGCEQDMAHRLVDYVFAHPPGHLNQELGGIGITLLALAQAAELSAEYEERREWDRVSAKPLEHFSRRNKLKNNAGFAVPVGHVEAPAGPAKEGDFRRKECRGK